MISGDDLRDLEDLRGLGYDLVETTRGWSLIHGQTFEYGLRLGSGGIEDALKKAKQTIPSLKP